MPPPWRRPEDIASARQVRSRSHRPPEMHPCRPATPAGQAPAHPRPASNILGRPRGKWCPEPESNQRHADFQSAALPTELSGPFRDVLSLGWRGYTSGVGGCPEGAAKKAPLLFTRRVFRWLRLVGRNAVASGHPAPEVDVGAALGTEGAIARLGRLATGRALHGSTTARGRRSRRRVISKSPSVVQPASWVCSPSDLKAARST
jgi:hypothetical protein